LVAELKNVVKRHKETWGYDPRGFGFYIRAAYAQTGGSVRTDYFSHVDRKWCENKAIERLSSYYT
jgi:hypothetical protein